MVSLYINRLVIKILVIWFSSRKSEKLIGELRSWCFEVQIFKNVPPGIKNVLPMTFPLNSDFPFQFSLLLLFLCALYRHGELEVDTGCLHPIYQGKVSPWTQTLTVSQLVFLTPVISSLPLDLWDYRQPPVLHRCWRSKPWSSQLHGKPCPQTHLSGAILFWYRVGLYYVAELRLASNMQYCWSCWVKGMHQHAWPWTSHSIHRVIREQLAGVCSLLSYDYQRVNPDHQLGGIGLTCWAIFSLETEPYVAQDDPELCITEDNIELSPPVSASQVLWFIWLFF